MAAGPGQTQLAIPLMCGTLRAGFLPASPLGADVCLVARLTQTVIPSRCCATLLRRLVARFTEASPAGI